MKAFGDIESVNLGTGERCQRVSGDGESSLVPLPDTRSPGDRCERCGYSRHLHETVLERGPTDPCREFQESPRRIDHGWIQHTDRAIEYTAQFIYAQACRGGPFEPEYHNLPEYLKARARDRARSFLSELCQMFHIAH